MQSVEGVDACRSPRREVAREQRDRGEKKRNDAVRRDVSRIDTEEKRGHEPGEKEGRHDSERDAESGQLRTISKNEPTHVGSFRKRGAEGHTHTDLTCPLRYRVRDHAIDTDDAENKRDPGGDREHHEVDAISLATYAEVVSDVADTLERFVEHLTRGFTPELAKHFAELPKPDPEFQARLDELATKANEGSLTPNESRE